MDITNSKILVVVYITVVIVAMFQMTGLFIRGFLPVTCTTSELDMQFIPKDALHTNAHIIFGTDPEFKSFHILESQNGHTWEDISLPFTNTGENDVILLKTSDLSTSTDFSLVWTEHYPDTTSFFISAYNSTWSDPEMLFTRDKPCYLKDALYCNDTLLILWEERYIVQRNEPFHKLSTVHRAVITDEISIEKIAIPEDSKDIDGFLLHHENIWCIVRAEKKFSQSWSANGKSWSEPQRFKVPVLFEHMLVTPQGEFGGYYTFNNYCFLYTTTNWVKWQKVHILKMDNTITAVQLAQNDNKIWGIASTKENTTTTYFCTSTPERIQNYQEKAQILRKIFSLQYTLILAVGVGLVLIKVLD
ncbi:MAG: hypothetical protein PVF58_04905 [Candidatus Methanofastidiosia archaeon]|jgi:hypothetical protein